MKDQLVTKKILKWYDLNKRPLPWRKNVSFKNSNKFSVSTLIIMVKRGHEVELEYSKKMIIDKMNSFFRNEVVERIKLTSFNDEKKISNKEKNNKPNINVTNNRFRNKLKDVKNEKIKKSLLELTKVFKEK